MLPLVDIFQPICKIAVTSTVNFTPSPSPSSVSTSSAKQLCHFVSHIELLLHSCFCATCLSTSHSTSTSHCCECTSPYHGLVVWTRYIFSTQNWSEAHTPVAHPFISPPCCLSHQMQPLAQCCQCCLCDLFGPDYHADSNNFKLNADADDLLQQVELYKLDFLYFVSYSCVLSLSLTRHVGFCTTNFTMVETAPNLASGLFSNDLIMNRQRINA